MQTVYSLFESLTGCHMLKHACRQHPAWLFRECFHNTRLLWGLCGSSSTIIGSLILSTERDFIHTLQAIIAATAFVWKLAMGKPVILFIQLMAPPCNGVINWGSFYVFVLRLRFEFLHVCTNKKVNANANAGLIQTQTLTRRHYTTTL